MIYLIAILINTPLLAIGLIFMSALAALYVLDRTRRLLYAGAMDLLTIRERVTSQALETWQRRQKMQLEIDHAQQALKARRLELASSRHRLLDEIDKQMLNG